MVHATTVLATDRCTFDRGQHLEDPTRIEALERDKRNAREHRATDRLHHAAPSATALFAAAAKRHHHLSVLARGLIELLDAHGPVALERAIAAALEAEPAYLAGVSETPHRPATPAIRPPPPLPLALRDDPRLRSLHVRPHDLADYDRVHDDSTTVDDPPHRDDEHESNDRSGLGAAVPARLGAVWPRRPGPRRRGEDAQT